ncbi:hypothetical protein BGX27_010763 [Mortierella sp. AM989]|nr:hypothetical protein BGX27_010763 [Mortierella sp. AM989]
MSTLTVSAAPPPPPSSHIMVVTEPNYSNYTVGERLYVKAYLRDEKFKKLNSRVNIAIQKSITYPQLNERLGSIRARRLEGREFSFKLRKEWLIEQQKNIPFRIRVSWSSPKSGYQDSEDFYFHE